MYYEYFRERAASCRRDAEHENAWLSGVSLEMADMFEDMADDALARELRQPHYAGPSGVARPAPPVTVSNVSLRPDRHWWPLLLRWQRISRFTQVKVADCP